MKPAAVPGRSLRIRLLAGTLVWIVATIAIAGWVLAGLFRQHAAEQFRVGLESQLEQLTANLTIDQTGKVYLAAPLSDPRLSRPNSGLYWQIDPLDSTQTVTLPERSARDPCGITCSRCRMIRLPMARSISTK